MQPAVADVVQNSILPLSTATAGDFFVARMSLPWCGPPARGWPKSSPYVVGAATGKMRVGTTPFIGAADAAPARPRSAAKRRSTPRAVVRWRLIKLRFALEGWHPTPDRGQPGKESSGVRQIWGPHAAPVGTGGSARGRSGCGRAGGGAEPSARGPPGGAARAGPVSRPDRRARRAADRRRPPRVSANSRAARDRHRRRPPPPRPLGPPLVGSRTLTRGTFGWDVSVLQFLLNRHGIRVPVNAYMDGPTVLGVRSEERRVGKECRS